MRKQLIAKEESEGYSLSALHRNYVIMICCHYKEREHTNRRKRRYQVIPTLCNASTYEAHNMGRYNKVILSNPTFCNAPTYHYKTPLSPILTSHN